MLVKGESYRTIWLAGDNPAAVKIIDQRFLPHKFVIEDLKTPLDAARAIKEMHVRGAPLIGAAAAFGVYLAVVNAGKDDFAVCAKSAASALKAARPTAVNLSVGVDTVLKALNECGSKEEALRAALAAANTFREKELSRCKRIGHYGASLIEEIAKNKKGEPVNILTHCNAGWLACIDYGTATAPVYEAFSRGIKLHVWVDETRPRNQGARLTAWELMEQGVPHTVIVDNAGGYLMQRGRVDIVIVGTDRTAANGDVANKIGTYLKALAAKDNNIPFYVALPSSSFDPGTRNGSEIEIELRGEDEVKYVQGALDGCVAKVLITQDKSPVLNPAFDITPGSLVTGFITERGICAGSELKTLSENRKNE